MRRSLFTCAVLLSLASCRDAISPDDNVAKLPPPSAALLERFENQLAMPSGTAHTEASWVAHGFVVGKITHNGSGASWAMWLNNGEFGQFLPFPSGATDLGRVFIDEQFGDLSGNAFFAASNPCGGPSSGSCPMMLGNSGWAPLPRPAGFGDGVIIAIARNGLKVGVLRHLTTGASIVTIWGAGTASSLFPTSFFEPAAINSLRNMAGSRPSAGGQPMPYLYIGNGLQNLPLLPNGTWAKATGIDDSGFAVGYGDGVGADGVYRDRQPIFWSNAAVPLPVLPGSEWCEATAMSPNGHIAGRCQLPGGSIRVVMWQEGQAHDMGSGTRAPVSIDESGVIVADELLGGLIRAEVYLGSFGDPPPGGTPLGYNIVVTPNDGTTGQPSPVSITFAKVVYGGTTSVNSGTIGNGGGPPAPVGLRLGNPPVYFDISMTADDIVIRIE